MKMTLIIPATALLLNGFYTTAQNEIVDNVEPTQSEINVGNSKSVVSLNFIDMYDINTQTAKKAKVLNDTPLRVHPNNSSQQLVLIPKGAVVETYKYFPKEAAWAVHYDRKWGFVTTTAILPLLERNSDENQKPYDEAPKMLSSIQIIYPPEARENKISGKVIIKALVSKTGSVIETEVEESIPGLNEAAIDAIRKMKFKPGKFEGKPVEVWIRIPVDFEPGDF
jgi:TonB family protein